MKMIVIRDAGGKAINIGPWDYMSETAPDGSDVVLNPLPEGATSAEEDVFRLPDGGLSPLDRHGAPATGMAAAEQSS